MMERDNKRLQTPKMLRLHRYLCGGVRMQTGTQFKFKFRNSDNEKHEQITVVPNTNATSDIFAT